MAHQAKALATKFDKLNLIPGPHIGKDRTKSYMLSSDHTHVVIWPHMPCTCTPPYIYPIHTHTTKKCMLKRAEEDRGCSKTNTVNVFTQPSPAFLS